MIKYALRKNQLATEEPNFVANVTCMASKTLDDLVAKMVAEGTGLTRPQALAYFEKITQLVIEFLEDGCAVNTPLFKVRPTIKGVFGNYQDIFNPAQHRLSYTMCGGTRMEPVLKNVELVKLKSKLPFIESFFDGMSRQSNTVITPGGNAEIKGDSLLFNIDDPGQGVFFCPETNPKTEIRALAFLKNGIKETSFMIPPLEAGNYILKVKTGSARPARHPTGKRGNPKISRKQHDKRESLLRKSAR